MDQVFVELCFNFVFVIVCLFYSMFYHSGYPMSTDVEFRFPWIQYDKCDTPLLWVEVDLYVKQWVEYTMLIFNIW